MSVGGASSLQVFLSSGREDVLAASLRSFAEAPQDLLALAAAVTERVSAALAASCFLATITDDGKWLAPLAATPLGSSAPAEAAALERLVHSRPIDLAGRGPMARAIESAEPVVINRVPDEMITTRFPAPDDQAAARALDMRHLLLVPLRARGVSFGGLTLIRHGGRATPFGDADVAFARLLADHAALALVNARLLARLQGELVERDRLHARQRLLTEVAGEFSAATMDTGALVALIARRLAELVGEECTIRMVDAGGTLGSAVVHHPDPERVALTREVLATMTQRVGEGISGKVAATGVAIRLADVDPEVIAGRLDEPLRSGVLRLGIRSVLCAPLLVDGTVIAVASLGRTAAGTPYSDDDLAFVDSVLSHAALAISNGRLLATRSRELAERTRMAERLRVLNDLSRDLAAATGDARRLLELATRRVGEILGDMCAIRLATDDGQALEASGCLYHPDPAVAARVSDAMFAAPLPAGAGLVGRVLATAQPVLLNLPAEELAATAPPALVALARDLRLTGFLSVPLLSRGRVIAVISLTRVEGSPPFNDEDLRFVEELGRHVALAIDNSRLVESLQRQLAERLRTEETLRRTEEQFRHAQKMEAVGRLAGGIAHDFNNLLSVILGGSALVLHSLPADAAAREDLESIVIAGERAADLTRQLLAFSRKQVTAPKVVVVNAVIRSMDKMIERMVGEAVRVDLRLADDIHPTLVDPGHLTQVIMNLAVNARDAMRGGGTLTIETQNVDADAELCGRLYGLPPGPCVMLAVGDTGVGIAHAIQDRIFEPFFTTKDHGQGTGLGLSTVLGIVEQSGGRIAVDSEPGRGTTFRIYLPRTEQRMATPVPSAPVATAPGHEAILVVEDNPQVRAVTRSILQRGGYRVLEASCGDDALRMCAEPGTAFALLLTDVVLPGMGGRELAERLLAARPEVRVLYMTGYTDDEFLRDRSIGPGLALIEKPFRPEALIERVRGILGGR
jgi:two-component system cell cycle sensor histidine kinase/response regulator CckA